MARQPLWHRSLNDPNIDKAEAQEEYLDRKLGSMTVKSLQDLAAEHDVDLGDARRKPEIIAKLKDSITAVDLSEDDDDDDDPGDEE